MYPLPSSAPCIATVLTFIATPKSTLKWEETRQQIRTGEVNFLFLRSIFQRRKRDNRWNVNCQLPGDITY